MFLNMHNTEDTPINPHRLLTEWQNILGLNDWRIEISPNCAPHEIESNAVGYTEWQEAIKAAHVYILDEKYYGERVVPFDFEKTLVHELLHLKTCLLFNTGNELQDRIAHQLIDDLARSFVAVKRTI